MPLDPQSFDLENSPEVNLERIGGSFGFTSFGRLRSSQKRTLLRLFHTLRLPPFSTETGVPRVLPFDGQHRSQVFQSLKSSGRIRYVIPSDVRVRHSKPSR